MTTIKMNDGRTQYDVVDGHRLFCYRCEYTTYSLNSLKKMSE